MKSKLNFVRGPCMQLITLAISRWPGVDHVTGETYKVIDPINQGWPNGGRG